MAAMEKVLNLPELLEMIVLHLPARDKPHIIRVSKYWRDLIQNSRKIQRALIPGPSAVTKFSTKIRRTLEICWDRISIDSFNPLYEIADHGPIHFDELLDEGYIDTDHEEPNCPPSIWATEYPDFTFYRHQSYLYSDPCGTLAKASPSRFITNPPIQTVLLEICSCADHIGDSRVQIVEKEDGLSFGDILHALEPLSKAWKNLHTGLVCDAEPDWMMIQFDTIKLNPTSRVEDAGGEKAAAEVVDGPVLKGN